MKFIDTHCHIDFPDFDADRDEVISHAGRLGVSAMIVPGVDASTWSQMLVTCKRFPGLYPALGLHPVFMERHDERDLSVLESTLAGRPEIIAVGEIGLDSRSPDVDKPRQQRLFAAQLAIARDAGLPVILHVVKAHEQALQALKHAGIKGGVVHAFSGSLEQAKRYICLGFKLGVGGMVSYPRSHKLHTLVQQLPLESLVLETDAPDMRGAVCQGQRNSPVYIPDYFRALVEWRDESPETIAQVLWRNSLDVFELHIG